MLTAISAMLIVTQVSQIVDPKMAERFQSLEWTAPQTQGRRIYQYRLFIPEGVQHASNDSSDKSGKCWPLLVWLHGFGERGNDNTSHLKWLQLIFDATNDSPPMFILAVQYPSEHDGWFSSVDSLDGLSITNHILEEVLQRYLVDPDRIYLSGVSAGGSACWEFACRHPERFAAVAPLASSGGDPSRAATLSNVAIWAFHSCNDKKPTPESARNMVEAIQRTGGIAALTETPSNLTYAHDCWTTAFRDYDLVDWLLSQRRGASINWWPPGLRRWAWWQIPAWSAVIAVIVVAWIAEKLRRSRSKSHLSDQF
jgi:predicted peptidase